MAREGVVGLARTVPTGMEASSACACMSVLGYDPRVYYRGRAAIEARSMGIDIANRDVVFRCNLVAIRDGTMWSYSSGYISTDEARELVVALNESLGSEEVRFYPGVSYRHLLKLTGHEDTLSARCTPPHDIPDKPVADFLPTGSGSEQLRDLMTRSEAVLKEHPVNVARRARGDIPATTIWLFWGSGQLPDMPAFTQLYGLDAAMTSGVDLLSGLARLVGMEVLDIAGVTDGQDNDYAAQAVGALKAEAPDEAGHDAAVDDKVQAIQRIDSEVVSRLRSAGQDLRLLVMPDHPTPIPVRTHTADPVPFLLWGAGFKPNWAKAFSEAEAVKTGLFLEEGYNIMGKLLGQGEK